MLNTHEYVSLSPYLCITVVVPANNDFRRKKLPEIVATMNHCRSAPLRDIGTLHNPHTTQKIISKSFGLQHVTRVLMRQGKGLPYPHTQPTVLHGPSHVYYFWEPPMSSINPWLVSHLQCPLFLRKEQAYSSNSVVLPNFS